MYKTLLHVMFGCNDGNGNVYRQDVFKELQLPVAPAVGFRFCPDSRLMNQCDEWEVEEVIYDINAATFIAVARCMDCEEPAEVDAYLEAFAACNWKTSNPLGY